MQSLLFKFNFQNSLCPLGVKYNIETIASVIYYDFTEAVQRDEHVCQS